MEFNEQNQNTAETNANQRAGMPKVSIPIYTQENGFYRYNYEKERLEFINSEKVIAFTREIPLDQWEDLPSHEDYCRNITEQANEQVRLEQRASKRTPIIYVLLVFIAPVLLLFLLLKFVSSPILFALILMAGIAILLLVVVKLFSK